MDLDPIFLRALERILVVLTGGLSIVLGYRLFLAMPHQERGEGKFELPGGVSIFITRVGPGVFFALFGAAVVSLSLHESITYSRQVQVGQNKMAVATRARVSFGCVAVIRASPSKSGQVTRTATPKACTQSARCSAVSPVVNNGSIGTGEEGRI